MEQVHPFIVHFPLALFISAGFMGTVGLFYRRGLFKELVFWQNAIGMVFLALAIYSGLEEEGRITTSFATQEMISTHKKNAYIITVIFGLLTLWMGLRKRQMKIHEYATWLVFVVIGSVAVIYQAYLGSQLVFNQGIGVKPMEQRGTSPVPVENVMKSQPVIKP